MYSALSCYKYLSKYCIYFLLISTNLNITLRSLYFFVWLSSHLTVYSSLTSDLAENLNSSAVLRLHGFQVYRQLPNTILIPTGLDLHTGDWHSRSWILIFSLSGFAQSLRSFSEFYCIVLLHILWINLRDRTENHMLENGRMNPWSWYIHLAHDLIFHSEDPKKNWEKLHITITEGYIFNIFF